MRIEYLYYFYEAASTLSLSKASQNCHITQQTMSNALKAMEETFEVKLYNRTNYGIMLTDDGLQMKEKVGKILDIYNSMLPEINTDEIKPKDCNIENVHIVFPSIITFLLDTCSNYLHEKYRNINFILAENSKYNAAKFLPPDVKEDIIVYFVMKHEYTPELLANNENYLQEIIHMDEIVVLAGQKSALFNKKTVSHKLLNQYPFIIAYNDMYLERLNSFLFPYGLPQKMDQTNNTARIFEKVKNDEFLTFGHTISRKHPYYKNKKMSVVKLNKKINIYYILAIKKDSMNKPYIQDTVSYIKSLI